MGYLKIHCRKCRKSWEVYHRDNWHDDRVRQCPHCFAEIEKQTWENQVLPAFGTMSDMNRELRKDYDGYSDRDLFLIDYRGNRELLRK